MTQNLSFEEKEKYKKIIEKYLDLFSEIDSLEKDVLNIKEKVVKISDKKQIHDLLEKINSIPNN
jgi:hypothetical protein